MNQSKAFAAPAASLLIAAALLIPATAAAGSRASDANVVTIDCASKVLPSQAEVGQALGIHNFSDAYDARTRLMVEVNHACRRQGKTEVKVTLAPASGRAPQPVNPGAMKVAASPKR